ncbi:hypothetical protein ACIGCK_04795 [Microbacterium sp. NPDC078428]|uniref:hypothetical protein n=1 Tax=Microbacterium sp. NPDC078428 TaxID=3364190 RepID=UPI0037C7AF4C
MNFPHGVTVYRLRGGLVTDPYSGGQIPADWANPVVLEIPGAFIAQSSTSTLGDSTRTLALESKSLFCPPDTDVQIGDRIREGGEGGTVYTIDGIPSADVNPWTGWQPVREIPLQRYTGSV